ncbi:hypothetical protein IMZ48_03590 [Candidatus Bathyarchaeota archaeon]|nr:hypothetical protein [Candidatus Bathyarchaeota archaeon]
MTTLLDPSTQSRRLTPAPSSPPHVFAIVENHPTIPNLEASGRSHKGKGRE